jgi:hypothetical protein
MIKRNHFNTALPLATLILAFSGCATSSGSGDSPQLRNSAANASASTSLPVVLTLQAETGAFDDPLALLDTLSRYSSVAHVVVDHGRDGAQASDVSVALVFPDREEFSRWYGVEAPDFLERLGNEATIWQTSWKDKALLETAGMNDLATMAEHFSVVYENSGSTEDGDADIDAVTTICADGAICKPSN